MSSLLFRSLLPILVVCALPGCRPSPPAATVAPVPIAASSAATPAPDAPLGAVRFVDATKSSGLRWRHHSGAFGLKLMPETMGSGVAFIDFDGDGYQDLFFVNGRDWTPQEVEQYRGGQWSKDEKTVFQRQNPSGAPLKRKIPPLPARRKMTGALYHNNGDGTFRDVTKGSGLDIEMYGMGAAVGDYDNDGRADLFVTGLGRNYLFHNASSAGQARFVDVSGRAGVRGEGWSTSAAWVDYDRDGRLDLFVCRYVKWTPALDRYGTMNGRDKSYTAPYFYAGQRNLLLHNEGARGFVDVSKRAGIDLPRLKGKALGVAVCDPNGDGWPDIVVSNDSEPNLLFENKKNGTFAEKGLRMGVALDSNGQDRAGMGIDTADVDHSNRDSIVIGNFDAEMMGYYYDRGQGAFIDIAPVTEVGKASKTFSVFGCAFLDADNDTWPDIFAASGHIDPQIDGVRGTAYALRPLLFHNEGHGKYLEMGQSAGEALRVPRVGRGLACADYDLDGDTDIVMTTNNGAPVLWRNDSPRKNGAIRLTLRGAKSNRSGVGSLVTVKLGQKDGLRRWVRSGSSYLSQSELPLSLGIGPRDRVPQITIRWPSGAVTRLRDVGANQAIQVEEGKGIVGRRNLKIS